MDILYIFKYLKQNLGTDNEHGWMSANPQNNPAEQSRKTIKTGTLFFSHAVCIQGIPGSLMTSTVASDALLVGRLCSGPPSGPDTID